jgi:NitT/TauT family transport system permease protein
VTGLKQGWAFAWRSLMSGELVVIVTNTASIGVLLENAQNLSDMPSAIAVMIVILALGILIDGLFTLLDNVVRRRWGLIGADES